MKIGRNRWEFIELDKDNIRVENYDHAPRQMEAMDGSIPKNSFQEAEDKFKHIIPYQLKRAVKIAINRKGK